MKERERNMLWGKAGFTLVELIVVIAILGILAGIGTVGYSGYMKKAHQAADLQMSGDVNYALQLYGVSNNLGLNQKKGTMLGYVLLTEDAPVLSDPSLGAALTNMFGSGYNSALKLQYDNWTPEMLSAAVSGVAESVTNSSYVTGAGTDKLLGDVQKCTTGLSGFMQKFVDPEEGPVQAVAVLANFLGTDENSAFLQVLKNAGYTSDNHFDGVTTDALGNATVFGIADYVKTNSGEVKGMMSGEELVTTPMTDFLNSPDPELNLLTTAALWYASMEGLASHLNNQAMLDAFDRLTLDASTAEGICGQMDVLHETLMEEYDNGNITDEDLDNYFSNPSGGKSQAEINAEAFISIMDTVDSMSNQYSNAADLNNSTLMTDSGITNQLNNYVAGATVSSALAGTIGDGSFGIVYLFADGKGGVTGSIDMVDKRA